MSVVNRVAFHPGGQVVNDADAYLYPTDQIDVQDANYLRVRISITGSGAGSTGAVRVSIYGVSNSVVTTQPFAYTDLTAGGVATIINGDILFDVTGFDFIVLRFGYDNGGAADNVTISGEAMASKEV